MMPPLLASERSSAWLERQLWELDVAGSNPVAPTTFNPKTNEACDGAVTPAQGLSTDPSPPSSRLACFASFAGAWDSTMGIA